MDDRLLFEQFHAAYDVEPRPGSFERLRSTLVAIDVRRRTRGRPALKLPRDWLRVAAVAALVVLALASVGAFVAINLYAHRSVPVHPGPFKVRAPGTAVCIFSSASTAQSCEIDDAVFVSPSVGFVLEATAVAVCSTTCPSQTVVVFRTGDAGLHWQPVYTTKLACCQQLSRLLASSDGKQILALGPPTSTTVLAFSSDAGATWQSRRLPAGATGASETLCAPPYKGGKCASASIAPQVYFLDPRQGWVVSQEQSFGTADLFRTTDGGANWTLVTTIDVNKDFGLTLNNEPAADGTRADATLRGQFVFRGTSLAWFIPPGSCVPQGPSFCGPPVGSLHLFRSIDGGLTWKSQSVPAPLGVSATDPGTMSVKFFNDRQGILELVVNPPVGGGIVEKRFVYTTSDGGITWSSPIAVPQPSFYASMRYIEAEHWVGWPYGGGLISTSDAGQHWQVVPGGVQFGEPPAPGAGLPGQLPADYPLRGLYGFIDPSHGWALPYQTPTGDPNARGLALFVTSDGGVNWHPLSLPELL